MTAVPDSLHAKRILVVDDVEMSRRVVARMLSHAGYDPICVHSGATALVCLERAHFDAMVLDLKMPGMDGWQVLHAVRALAPRLPIVLHSAHEQLDPVLTTEHICFLRKPYRPADLTSALARVL